MCLLIGFLPDLAQLFARNLDIPSYPWEHIGRRQHDDDSDKRQSGAILLPVFLVKLLNEVTAKLIYLQWLLAKSSRGRRKQKVLSSRITIQLTELRELYKNRRNPYFTTSLALQIRELITCSLNDIRIHVNNYFHYPPRGNPPWRLSVTSLPRDNSV